MIKQVNVAEEKNQIFFLLHQLYPDLSEDQFIRLLPKMLEKGYQVIGYYDGEKLIGIAGYNVEVNFYDGKHLYLYDLVCDANHRSKGYGAKLIAKLEDIARSHECHSIVLCSNFARVDAHRFYTEKLNFEKVRYVIKQQL